MFLNPLCLIFSFFNYSLLHFRMMGILLPAYSRHYSSLLGAGLVTAADEKQNHELEHLVLRERGVVWADQDGMGQLKGEETRVDAQKKNEGSTGLHSELAPLLSFSHVLYHQNSPCSKFSYILFLSLTCPFSMYSNVLFGINYKTSEILQN